MASNFITRGAQSVQTEYTQEKMATRFENMLNSVSNMLVNDGPIYSTWIYFQIGVSDPIYFNSASTNPKQNLIASLSMEKNSSGIANSFTLVIQYDPFNMGQNATDQLEALDEYISDAMNLDFDDVNNTLRGKIQYGYNSTSDNALVSPLYSFIITSATSDVKFDSGIATYTFSGTSTIASDSNFATSYPAVNNEPLMRVIERTLYQWYGTSEHPAPHITDVEPVENDFKYIIDISDSVYNDCQDITEAAVADATMSPFVYCKNLLQKYYLTKSELESGEFSNVTDATKLPKYSISFTDVDGQPTIHITHCAPSATKDESGKEKAVEANEISINYEFSWGKQQKNIVTGWTPEVNLYQYLIGVSQDKRLARLKQLVEDNPDNTEYKSRYESAKENAGTPYVEMYNATLTILGIPADPPICAEVTIIPRILESVSRTAGIYSIISCSDEISSAGVYTTTLKLFRQRSIDTKTINYGIGSGTEGSILYSKMDPEKEGIDPSKVDPYYGATRA